MTLWSTYIIYYNKRKKKSFFKTTDGTVWQGDFKYATPWSILLFLCEWLSVLQLFRLFIFEIWSLNTVDHVEITGDKCHMKQMLMGLRRVVTVLCYLCIFNSRWQHTMIIFSDYKINVYRWKHFRFIHVWCNWKKTYSHSSMI